MPKYRWLFYEENVSVNDSNTLHALNNSDISVDAEITYLNLHSLSSMEYELYDVYNNAYGLGGQLNVVRDSSLFMDPNVTSLTDSMRTQISKYLYRNKLPDITPRVGIVVSQLNELNLLTKCLSSYLFTNSSYTILNVSKRKRIASNTCWPIRIYKKIHCPGFRSTHSSIWLKCWKWSKCNVDCTMMIDQNSLEISNSI